MKRPPSAEARRPHGTSPAPTEGERVESPAVLASLLGPGDVEAIRRVVRSELAAALADLRGAPRARTPRPAAPSAPVGSLDRAAAIRLAREMGLPLTVKGRRG